MKFKQKLTQMLGFITFSPTYALLDLRQPFQALLDRLGALVGADPGDKFLQPGPFQQIVNSRP